MTKPALSQQETAAELASGSSEDVALAAQTLVDGVGLNKIILPAEVQDAWDQLVRALDQRKILAAKQEEENEAQLLPALDGFIYARTAAEATIHIMTLGQHLALCEHALKLQPILGRPEIDQPVCPACASIIGLERILALREDW